MMNNLSLSPRALFAVSQNMNRGNHPSMIEKMGSKGIIILLGFLSIWMGCADSSNETKPTGQSRNPSFSDTFKKGIMNFL